MLFVYAVELNVHVVVNFFLLNFHFSFISSNLISLHYHTQKQKRNENCLR